MSTNKFRASIASAGEGDDAVTELIIRVPARYREHLKLIAKEVETLVRKNAIYGDSWKRRGGAGAFLTLVRPWDRLEKMAESCGYDVFAAGERFKNSDADSDIVDSLQDVRNYCLLIAAEILERRRGGDASPETLQEKATSATGN